MTQLHASHNAVWPVMPKSVPRSPPMKAVRQGKVLPQRKAYGERSAQYYLSEATTFMLREVLDYLPGNQEICSRPDRRLPLKKTGR
jgi:hypothetical protein